MFVIPDKTAHGLFFYRKSLGLNHSTMKTLYLLRHAKAESFSRDKKDFDRAIDEFGYREIDIVASIWKEKGEIPSLVLSSSALRTRTTAEKMADALGVAPQNLVLEPKLYNAPLGEYNNQIFHLPNNVHSVMMVGHNPAMSLLLNYLSADAHVEMPTCGLARIDFELNDWRYVSSGMGKLAWFEFPAIYSLR